MPSPPLRLAIIRQRYTPYGGAERFIERALSALQEEGATISLLTRSWQGAPKSGFEQIILDPPYSRLFGGRAARDKSFAKAVRAHLTHTEYDITQTHERIPECTIFRAGDGVHAAWLHHRTRGTSPWVRWATHLSSFHRHILHEEAAMLNSETLRAVICNSQMVRQEMEHYYPKSAAKLVVIENGVDLEDFHPRLQSEYRVAMRQQLSIDAECPVFLYVGSGFLRKGVAPLLDAFAQMSHKNSRLLIVGQDRHAHHYEAKARALKLETRVRFMGPQQDVRPFYGLSDAFVLPTRYDPMPNAALEALASGLPTLTSTTSGIAERITSGENGYVCDALDIKTLAQHLDALANIKRTEAMREAARASVADLSLHAMAEKLLGLYTTLR